MPEYDRNPDLDDPAELFLAAVMRPRRRARPRVAEPLRDAEEFSVETPGGAVAAWRLGEGPAVLLVHGWEDDNALWTRLIDRLKGVGRAVVAFDLPAHGLSEGDQCAPPQAAEAIRAVSGAAGLIDAIVAHSFGGPTSVMAMAQGLEIARIALLAVPLGRRARWGRAAQAMGVSDEILQSAKTLYESRVGAAAHFDLREAAKTMRARALFLHSLDDDQVPFGGAKEASENWPVAELVLVDGLGHRLIAQDPSVIERLVDFLDAP